MGSASCHLSTLCRCPCSGQASVALDMTPAPYLLRKHRLAPGQQNILLAMFLRGGKLCPEAGGRDR